VAYPFFLKRLLVRTGLARLLPSVGRWTDGGGAFLRYYSDRVLAAPLGGLQAAAGFLEIHGPDAIDLARGAPVFDLVPSGSTKLPADRRGWPPVAGLAELRQAIALELHSRHGIAANPADEVLVTPGAAGAFSIILDTFLNPGDRVVLFDPTSPLYPLMLKQRRARLRWLRTWMDGGQIRFRPEELARLLRGARLLVLNSPATPTGGVLAPEVLQQIAWWAARRDVLVVSDEVFARYRYEGTPTGIATFPAAHRRTLTVGSLSKGHALASARVGWLAGNRHLVRPCVLTAALQAPFVPTLCQEIALAALRQGNGPFEPIRALFESRRRYTFERLDALGLKPAWPAGAFFLWVPIAELGRSANAFAEGLLREKRVLVSPGIFFGPSGRGHVRVSYATEDGRLREGLGRLGDYLRALRGSTTASAGCAA
jgi:aspartate/methionine/tyrosine aminotransferase